MAMGVSISEMQEVTFYLMLYSFAGWVLENSYSWRMMAKEQLTVV
jgi:hypothetical protein